MSCRAEVWLTKRRAKHGTTYAVRWIETETGKWRSTSCGPDRKHARAVARQKRHELEAGIRGETKRIGWTEFVAEDVASIEGARHAHATEATLNEFAAVCSPAGPHTVNYRLLEKYTTELRGRNLAPVTIKTKLTILRASLGRAKKRNYLRQNPFDQFDMPRVNEKMPRTFTADEKIRILQACPDHTWYTLVYLAMSTGARAGELRKLTWDAVNLDEKTVTFTETKGKRDRVAVLTDRAADVLREHLASVPKVVGPAGLVPKHTAVFATRVGTAWYPVDVWEGFKSILRAARIDPDRKGAGPGTGNSFKHLRSTAATDLARCGENQRVAQETLGHRSSTTTARYYQAVDYEMRRAAAAKLDVGVA